MNIDNDSVDPAMDLGLTLGYSSEFRQRTLNIESGAGVNAGLRINIPFVASSPLSELVWSPHKGLRIKCAERTFVDRRSSLLLGAGQSNVVLSTIGSIAISNDNPMDETFLTPRATVHVSEEDAEGNCSSKSLRNEVDITPMGDSSRERGRGTGGYGEGTKSGDVSLKLLHTSQEEDHLRDGEGKGFCSQIEAQTEELSNIKEEKVSSIPGLVKGETVDVLLHSSDKVKGNCLPIEHSFGSASGGIDVETLGRKMALPSNVCPNNECEASNFTTTDLIPLGRKRRAEQAFIVPEKSKGKMNKSGLEKWESTDENNLRTLTGKRGSKVIPSESTLEVQNNFQNNEQAPSMDKANQPHTNRKVDRHRRKGKEKALSGDEGSTSSHGSVESCNSAKSFPTEKNRWVFEQLLTHSKRAKREVQESDCSTSLARKNSSFMSWISNMVKGFGQSVEDKEPSTPLAFARPHPGHEHTSQKLILCDKTQDTGSLNIKSLYCSNTLVKDSRQSRDAELPTKISDIDATHEESGVFCKQFMQSKEKLYESMSTAEAGPSAMPRVPPVKCDSIQENCKTSSAENKNPYALVLGKENEGLSSKLLSPGEHKTNNGTEKNDSDLPSKGKTHILSNRSDTLRSLWVTRFSPKTSDSLSHIAHHNESAVCMKLDSHPHNNTEEPLTLSDRGLEDATNAEALTGLNRISVHIDVNICKLDSNLPSQRLESSEAMASVFARRLDAIKHIIPSGVTDDAATACFFCGIRGHRIQECPEIAENKPEDRLMNINLQRGAAESSCLCIRCFQLDHWAVSCPNPSREPRQMECAALQSMQGSTSKQQHIGGNKKTLIVTSDRMISGSTIVNKCIASSSLKNESREERIGSLSILNRQMLNMPMGIFDAMKRLRLSRTDILKWMSSDMSISRLNGFLLRLRLGKWEEGLGGTGYYVACIDGSELESLSPSSRNAIPVKVGSIKCLVGSKYISNGDFCDDELMAWWSAALDGGKIPSEEDLRARVEDKKMLGF